MSEPDLIVESKRLCKTLAQLLPRTHEPTSDATFLNLDGEAITAKIPTKLEAVIGSLAWRAHDFGTLACELFERQRTVPGAVIARSLMETSALVYLVYKQCCGALSDNTLDELDDFLVKCLSGNRLSQGDPESPKVLAAIKALDKEPGCDHYADFYYSLCEFAHPNALGSFYAYSSYDGASRRVSFGHNLGLTRGDDVAFGVVFALEVLLEFLGKIRMIMPDLVGMARTRYLQQSRN